MAQIETDRLLAEATQTRLRSIQLQVSFGYTLCATVETEIGVGELGVAKKLIQKLWHSAKTIGSHIDKPGRVPADEVARLHNELAQLEARIRSVEAQVSR